MKHKPLKKGDTIGVIAPGGPCRPELIEAGLETLRSLGMNPRVQLDPGASYGKDTYLFSSDSAEARARGIEELFADSDVRAIIAARGAYGCVELLPFIDFGILRNNSKPFVGCSDVTVLLSAFLQQAGVVTIHGANVSGGFARYGVSEAARKSVDALMNLLLGKGANAFEGLTFKRLSGSNDGKGPLLGGSLTVLTSLLGTPYEPDFDSGILFIEDSGERPYRIHRMLKQLELAGKLEGLVGVVLGDFKDCTHTTGPTLKDVVLDIFSKRSYPVLTGLPFGHEDLNLPLPLGCIGQVSGEQFTVIEGSII